MLSFPATTRPSVPRLTREVGASACFSENHLQGDIFPGDVSLPPSRRGIPATLQSVLHAGTAGEEQSVATHKLPSGVTQEVRHSPGSGRWGWTVQGRMVILRLGKERLHFHRFQISFREGVQRWLRRFTTMLEKERLRRQRSSQRLGLWEPFPLLTLPPLLERRLETLPSGSGDILPQSLVATQPLSRRRPWTGSSWSPNPIPPPRLDVRLCLPRTRRSLAS